MQRIVMDELLAFLDERQAGLEQVLDQLNVLRAAVIGRDEATLSRLFDQIQQDVNRQLKTDEAQRRLECRLAEAFNEVSGSMTLSHLCTVLPEEFSMIVKTKQKTLLQLVNRVRNEHQATELLLRECIRCNRQLLSAILGQKHQSVTYNPQGHGRWDVHSDLVSIKL
jgi:flagellar biosynthesis/type III secretory pathway chaperone